MTVMGLNVYEFRPVTVSVLPMASILTLIFFAYANV